MEIIKKEENGVEFYTIELTGQSGMSQTGLAILAGVSRTSIQDLEKTLATSAPSECLEPFVGEPLTLATDGVVYTINGKPVGNLKVYKASFCAAVLKHYADLDKKLNITEQQRVIATYSLLKFAEKGINTWIQEVTGWKKRIEAIQPHTDVYIQRIQHMRDHELDYDLWMIFREASELLLLIEKDWRVPVNEYDIFDGSIGRKWSDYRSDKPWTKQISTYNHNYRDQRGTRPCAAYKFDELPYFRKWLKEWYIPSWLPKYLIEKYGKQAVRQIYTENDTLTDEILALTEIKRLTPQETQSYQKFLLARRQLLDGFGENLLGEP